MIYETNDSFDFSKLTLNPPMVVSGGNYFIKYQMNGSNLYIQPPECKLRGQISKNSKRPFCDLLFSQENFSFIKWMEDLETQTCKLIHEKREDWFDSEMELEDIENYFATPLKSYKGGKYYLARSFLPSHFGKINLKVYNENKEEINIDNIQEDVNIASILEIQGIKCSSRSFQIEMEIKQMMTLLPVNVFDNCLINKTMKPQSKVNEENEVNHLEEILEPQQEAQQEAQEAVEEAQQEAQEAAEEETQQGEEEILEVKNDSEHLEENQIKIEEKTKDVSDEDSEESDEDSEDSEDSEDNSQYNDLDDLEFNVNLEELDNESIQIKPHSDIYYQRYREAQKRARVAKNLALQAYLEAKEIKSKYNLDDIESDDDDFFNNEEQLVSS